MKKSAIILASTVLLTSVSGCVGYTGYEPAPYYGGIAPYYGTAYVPAYAYGGIYGGGYYPYHHSANIYSGYNKGYWHYQHNVARGGYGAPRGMGSPHGNGGHR